MHEMKELREMLEDELKKITKQGKLSTSTLELADKITHAIKSIDTIMAMEEKGYSNARDRSYRGSYGEGSYRGSYDGSYDNYSNRTRRDGMRDQRYNYSREYSSGDYSNEGYSRRRGYSRDLKRDLEDLMHNVGNEEEHRMIKKWIKELDD